MPTPIFSPDATPIGLPRRLRAPRLAVAVMAVMVAAGVSVAGEPDAGWDGRIHAVQLHLHGSLSEGTGRMVNHTIRAQEAGVDVIWWTDHGGMYNDLYPEDIEALSMDFEEGVLWIPNDGIVKAHGFLPPADAPFTTAVIIDTAASEGVRSMALTAQDGAMADSAIFQGWQYEVEWHHAVKSLFQDVRIRFKARIPGGTDDDRIFTVMSRHSGDLSDEPMWIAFMATDGPLPPDRPGMRYARMAIPDTGQWTPIELNLTSTAKSVYEYGQDLHFHDFTAGWTVASDGFSMVLLDEVRIEVGPPYRDELMAAQKAFLDSLPGTSPTHLVGYETAGGRNKVNNHHINVYAPKGLPQLVDYEDPRYDPEQYPENFIQWAHGQGYATSYNHIFGPMGDADHISDTRRDQMAADLVRNNGYGCDLLEVGYDNRARPIEDHFATWDAMSLRDAFITGTGVSDHHKALAWHLTPNRFVSWVRVTKPAAGKLLRELLSGHTWFGDPLVVGSKPFVEIYDPAGRFTMGDVVVSDLSETTLEVRGRFEPEAMDMDILTVHWAASDTTRLRIPGADAPFRVSIPTAISDRCHVRVEFRSVETGELVMASNPVYFRRSAPSRDLTGMRLRNIVDISQN